MRAPHANATPTVGSYCLMAVTHEPELASMVLSGISGEPASSTNQDTLYVYSKANGVLSLPISSSGGNDALLRWIAAASYPTVERFDPGTRQGDRMRDGPIQAVMVLVGDENDLMWDDWLGALADTAAGRRGEANYLYADESEPRIKGILE